MKTYDITFFDSQFAMDPKPSEPLSWDDLKQLFSEFTVGEFDKTNGPHFNGCKFKAGTDRRQDNVQYLSVLVLDFDNGMPLRQAREHFKVWRHIGYTSYNHQYDKRGDGEVVDKFRILLPLATPIGVEHWKQIRHNVAAFAPDVDMASVRLHQPFATPLKRPQVDASIWTNEGEELDVTDWVRSQFDGGGYTSANPSLRSQHRLQPDDVLVTKNGNLRVGDIDRMITGVLCPFHQDKSPGEFVNKSEKGNVYLSCHKCGTIYLEREKPDYIETFLAEQKAKREVVLGEAHPSANQIEADIAAHDLVEYDNDLAVEPFSRERRAEILVKKYKPSELRTLLYASEGFGKSYLASVLCKRGAKVVFACKSNVQAAEQAQGFLDQGIKVQMIFSRDYWLHTNHKIEVAYYDQTHPWDYERLNEVRTKRNMAAMGMTAAEIKRLWDLYAPEVPTFESNDMIVTTQARVMGWGRVNEIRKGIRMRGVEPQSVPFEAGSLEQQESIVESRRESGVTGEELYGEIPIDPFTYVRDIIPRDAVIFCDDADSEDFCLLKNFDNKFAEKSVGGRPIETKTIGKRIYFVRPRDFLFGHGFEQNQIVFSTTELMTKELICARYGGLKHQETLPGGKRRTIGNVYCPDLMPEGKLIAGEITMIKTRAVWKKRDGMLPVIVERIKKLWSNPIEYIADGQGNAFNHTTAKGQNSLRDHDVIIELSHQHEDKAIRLQHELGWEDEDRFAVKVTLALDALHQSVGRNSGYRFSDAGVDNRRQSIVLVEPALFDAVTKFMRYQFKNKIDLDSSDTWYTRDDIGKDLPTTLCWYVKNQLAYIKERGGQIFIGDARKALKSSTKREARRKRLLDAIRTMSEDEKLVATDKEYLSRIHQEVSLLSSSQVTDGI